MEKKIPPPSSRPLPTIPTQPAPTSPNARQRADNKKARPKFDEVFGKLEIKPQPEYEPSMARDRVENIFATLIARAEATEQTSLSSEELAEIPETISEPSTNKSPATGLAETRTPPTRATTTTLSNSDSSSAVAVEKTGRDAPDETTKNEPKPVPRRRNITKASDAIQAIRSRLPAQKKDEKGPSWTKGATESSPLPPKLTKNLQTRQRLAAINDATWKTVTKNHQLHGEFWGDDELKTLREKFVKNKQLDAGTFWKIDEVQALYLQETRKKLIAIALKDSPVACIDENLISGLDAILKSKWATLAVEIDGLARTLNRPRATLDEWLYVFSKLVLSWAKPLQAKQNDTSNALNEAGCFGFLTNDFVNRFRNQKNAVVFQSLEAAIVHEINLLTPQQQMIVATSNSVQFFNKMMSALKNSGVKNKTDEISRIFASMVQKLNFCRINEDLSLHVNNVPFKEIKTIGDTSAGTIRVYEAQEKNSAEGQDVRLVVKDTKRRGTEQGSDVEISAARHEARLHALALGMPDSEKHPNILDLKGIGVTEGGGRQFTVLEYAPLGDAHSLLEKLANPEKLRQLEFMVKFDKSSLVNHLFNEILQGMARIHEKRIIHLDVKLPNILICEGLKAKFADFGIAQLGLTTGVLDRAPADNPRFNSPEANMLREHHTNINNLLKQTYKNKRILAFEVNAEMRKKPESHTLSQATDLWSLGVLLYQFVKGKMPFDGNLYATDIAEMIINFCKMPSAERYKHLELSSDNPIHRIIIELLDPVPENRPAAQALLDRNIFKPFSDEEAKKYYVALQSVLADQ